VFAHVLDLQLYSNTARFLGLIGMLGIDSKLITHIKLIALPTGQWPFIQTCELQEDLQATQIIGNSLVVLGSFFPGMRPGIDSGGCLTSLGIAIIVQAIGSYFPLNPNDLASEGQVCDRHDLSSELYKRLGLAA